MGKEILACGNTEIEKYKFHQLKSPILIDDIDVNKILVPNKIPCFKCFIAYKGNREVRPLCILLPKTSAYRKSSFGKC